MSESCLLAACSRERGDGPSDERANKGATNGPSHVGPIEMVAGEDPPTRVSRLRRDERGHVSRLARHAMIQAMSAPVNAPVVIQKMSDQSKWRLRRQGRSDG
jgi:hypothetical protein